MPHQRQTTIKGRTIDLILESKEDNEIIDTIVDEFPESAFDKGHISWYRSTLFKQGFITAEFAPRRSSAYKRWKQKQKGK